MDVLRFSEFPLNEKENKDYPLNGFKSNLLEVENIISQFLKNYDIEDLKVQLKKECDEVDEKSNTMNFKIGRLKAAIRILINVKELKKNLLSEIVTYNNYDK